MSPKLNKWIELFLETRTAPGTRDAARDELLAIVDLAEEEAVDKDRAERETKQ